MQKKRLIPYVSGVVLVALLMIIGKFYTPQEVSTQARYAKPQLTCRYYRERDFKLSLNQGNNITTLPEGINIKGGITPHHLLAGGMIADFFRLVSESNPDVLIILGPNHSGEGVKLVHTALADWNTPFGVLQADAAIINELIESGMVTEDLELLEKDHSISALIPYVKYFMPDTTIVPLLMTGTDRIETASGLGKKLGQIADERKALIIASVDFSHYLSLKEADKKDEVTKKALLRRDIQQIRAMDNDYMDSPISIITLLYAMEEIGAENQQIIAHDNSARISGSSFDNTTSYFTIVYW